MAAGIIALLTIGIARSDVVINELMYHPYAPFGSTNRAEYLEILNSGTEAVSMADYRFDNGVRFTFPSNYVLGAGAYGILCRDIEDFTNAYPSVTNVIGDYSGNLRNGGERVTLSRLQNGDWITVDTIEYIDGGPADGEGPSLELVNPGLAPLRNHSHGDWLPSAARREVLIPANSAWRYLDNGSDQQTAWKEPAFNDASWPLGTAELGYGDADETTTINFGTASDKHVTTYFRRVFTATNVAQIAQLNLALRRDAGAVVYLNGKEVRRDNLPATGTITATTYALSPEEVPWREDAFFPSILPAAGLVEGNNTLAVELHIAEPNTPDLSFNLSLEAVRGGTPGAQNSVYSPNPPPVVADVAHDPPLPPAGSAVAITATVRGATDEAVAGVTLHYRVNTYPPAAWSQQTMRDNGKGADAVAGDEVYTTMLPVFEGTPMGAGDMFEFTITATGTNGAMVTMPVTNTTDETVRPPYSYLVKFGEDTKYDGEYDTFHILLTESNRIALTAQNNRGSAKLLDCTIVTDDGEIFYNCSVRHRGNSSYQEPFSYRIEFPRGQAYDGFREWNFNHQRAILQYLGFKVFTESGHGTVAPEPHLARLWVNGVNKTEHVGNNQFHGIFMRFTTYDDDLMEQHHSGQIGNIYRGQGNNSGLQLMAFDPPPTSPYNLPGRYTYDANHPLSLWYDLHSVCTTLAGSETLYPETLTNTVDVRQWGRVYGTQVALENSEGGFHCARQTQNDDHLVYFDPNDGKMDLLPWDMDQVIQQGAGGGGNATDVNRSIWNYEVNTGPAVTVVRKFLLNPPIISYYVGDIVDVHETVLYPQNMSAIIDEMGSAVSAFKGVAPDYKARLLGDIALRRASIWSQINSNITVTVPGATANGAIASIVSGSSVSLSGQGPQGYTTDIRVNGSGKANWNTRTAAWSIGGQQTVTETYAGIDQGINGWTHLGTVALSGDGTEQIRLRRVTATGLKTIADALMLSNATSTVIVDNTDAGQFQVSGTWNTGTQSEDYGADFRWSVEAGATATWTPVAFPAGAYELYVWTVDYGRWGGESDPEATYEIVQSNDIVLTGAVNSVEITALDAEGDLVGAHTHFIISQGTPTNVSGVLATSTTWSADSGAIVVNDNVSVTSGVTLTIAPDTIVLVAPGKSILANGGTVDLDGTTAEPIHFFPSDGASAWSLVASGGGSITGSNAILTGGRLSADASGTVTVEDSEFRTYHNAAGIIASAAGGHVTLRRCIVSDYGSILVAGGALIEDCLLYDMRSAGVTFAAGTGTVTRTTVRDPAPEPGAAGITVSAGGSVTVSNCLVDGQFTTGVGTVQGAGTPRLLVRHSLVRGCTTGMAFRGAESVSNEHNTISACTLGLAGANTQLGSILWGNQQNTDGQPTFAHSDVQIPGTNVASGAGNLNRNPWFRDADAGDYRLQSISPCLGTAHDGGNMGPAFPVGANPAAPTALALANGLATGSNTVDITWQDNCTDETRFEIERAVGDGDWTCIVTLPADSTNYTDIAAPQNSRVSYRVRAAHRRGESLYAGPDSLTTTFGETARYLRITEFMYSPVDPLPGEPPVDNDDFEFIEFTNLGTDPLDVSGLYFSDGLTFTFPEGTVLQSGGRFLLIQDAIAFTARYPGVSYDAIVSGGRLNDGGEDLEISDPNGGAVLAFEYDNAWYPSTDEGGYSLVLVDPDGDLSSPAAWRPSGQLQGTPGDPDASPFLGTIVINEVFSHTDPPYEDAIELYNAGTVSVDIANWYLSDDEYNLTKYRITNATLSIPSGGYHVFYEGTSFGQGASPFALSEYGDSVYLSSGDGSEVTSYRTSAKFGAAPNSIAFGRYVRSDGVADFVAMSDETFGVANPASVAEFRTGTGQSNSYPRVGPIVINEIMYNPSATGKEFVELLNTATTNVPLYRGTNVWSFDGAMEFAFPPGTTMTPGEHVLVVSIDPAEFRTQFGLTNPALKVFGPFDGALNNAGESVKLYRPGQPDAGLVPRIRADRVKYDDEAPWPVEADNGGPSLERIDPRAYGNDPANWLATSFGGTPGTTNNVPGQPTAAFTVTTSSSVETNGVVLIGLSINPVSAATVTVEYVVSGGTAVNGTDFDLADGQAIFWPYDAEQVIPLTIKEDTEVEPNETIVLRLTGVSGGARLAGNRTHTHTIVDTDATALDPPSILPPGTNTFEFSTLVTMSTGIPGAEIRYTLDGKTPTLSDNLYTGQITLAASTRVKARSFLGSVNQSADTTALYLEQTAPPEGILSRRVSASADDADQLAGRFPYVYTDLSTLRMGLAPGGVQSTLGVRFTNLRIEKGVTVHAAHVQFKAAEAGSSAANLTIYGEAAVSPVPFAGGEGRDITDRSDTTAVVAWNNVPAWSAGVAGPNQQTPDISSIVQELVNMPDWTMDSALVIVVDDNGSAGSRTAYSWDGDSASAPLLYIEYESKDDGPPLTITGTEATAEGFRVYWTTVDGRTYAIYRSTNLLVPWPHTPLTSGIPAHPSGTNVFTDTGNPAPAAFYRIGEQ